MESGYSVQLEWKGDRGQGTLDYRGYDRHFELFGGELPRLPGSSVPMFRGDADRYNPEQLLLGALSACHMLWYLHLCADAGVVVTDYEDAAHGTSVDNGRGGRFDAAVLRPVVTVTSAAMVEQAIELHTDAHSMCLIAASVAFPVRHEPTVRVAR